jgi:hypothetical protein
MRNLIFDPVEKVHFSHFSEHFSGTEFFNISNDADRVKGFGVPDFIVSNTLIALAQTHCSASRE